MEKQNEFKAAAYDQIKKLGGNYRETIKTIETGIGTVDIRIQMEQDYSDIKKRGGGPNDRPYVYRASLEGANIAIQVHDKVVNKAYETAAEAFETTKKIVEKYVEGLKAIEAL